AGRRGWPTAAGAWVPDGRVEARPNGVGFVARAALVIDDGPPIGSPRIIGAGAGAPIVLPKAARRPAVIENKVKWRMDAGGIMPRVKEDKKRKAEMRDIERTKRTEGTEGTEGREL